MSSLTSTQINNTYPGLLKLSTSTTGITSTLQSVEDGLGGDTGLKIKQDYLGGSSLSPFPKVDTTKQVFGTGVAQTGAGTAFNSGSHNLLFSMFWYDRGHITYSAISYSVGTVSTTSDVIEMGIYDSQMTTAGLQPKSLIGSTWTLSGSEVTTLNLAKKTLPSNVIISEGGYYFLVIVGTNGTLVTPTVRFRNTTLGTFNGGLAASMLGFTLDQTLGGYVNVNKIGPTLSQGGTYYPGISGPLASSYAAATFEGVGATAGGSAVSYPGFVLHPVN